MTTCRYCDTETPNYCCGAPECRSRHGAKLLRDLAAVHETEAARADALAASPAASAYRDLPGYARRQRNAAARARASADAAGGGAS